ncbi:MAG: iron-containing alcohol dehydrogenase [Synergistales bacterium]|nr:iron-containing alcohol dehydrogenase [Synergistales bacterium]
MWNMIDSYRFALPTTISFGPGIVGQLDRYLESHQVREAMVVTDSGVMEAGLLTQIENALAQAGVHARIFSEVAPNPREQDVQKGVEALPANCDCVIAVGGGSPIDCAKCIALIGANGGDLRDYEGRDRVPSPCIPLIAIPTTAGTGSEVTFSAVITDTAKEYKFSVTDEHIAASLALVDPLLTTSLPRNLTAATGLDALTHAIEAYTARQASPLSDALALHAVELIGGHLENAWRNGDDREARAGMLQGSLIAGLAFSHADVGPVHCLAESMGGMFDLPHGLCNAIVLPYMIEHNAQYCAERYTRIARLLQDDPETWNASSLARWVRNLAERTQLPPFAELGIPETRFQALAEKSVSNGSNGSNPVALTQDEYLAIIQRMNENTHEASGQSAPA